MASSFFWEMKSSHVDYLMTLYVIAYCVQAVLVSLMDCHQELPL